MVSHNLVSDIELWRQIRKGEIIFGGNSKLKIYGHLNCKSGKRMKRDNRVFFKNEDEALAHGYRPCGHCMRTAYHKWKKGECY